MLAEVDPRRWLLQQRRQPLLAIEERQVREVLAVEVKEVEGEMDEAAIAGVRALLHQFEERHAVFADAAQLASVVAGVLHDLGRREALHPRRQVRYHKQIASRIKPPTALYRGSRAMPADAGAAISSACTWRTDSCSDPVAGRHHRD